MDSSKDPRCQYIGNTAAAMFGKPNLASQIAQSEEVHQFLNELNVKVVQILSDGSQFRCFANQVSNPPANAPFECHFVKLGEGSEEITADKIALQVMVSSIRNSSIHSLHAYLNCVYGPVLFGTAEEAMKSGGKSDNHLRDLLYSLKAGLNKSLRRGRNDLLSTDFNQDEFRGILSPNDEIECWSDLERELITSHQGDERLRAKAETISKHFSKVSGPLAEIQTLELGQVSALIDNMQDVLDQIWKDPDVSPPYPQARMEHLFRITTKAIGSRIERHFKEHDVWQSSFSDVRVQLNESMRIFRSWKDRVTELTRDFWQDKSGGHVWKGKAFFDTYLENIILRINEIFELRSQHDELLRLLTQEERNSRNVEATFDPFKKINSFYTNEFQVSAWHRAVKEYENMLQPIEKDICQKLRTEIFSEGKASPSQLLREFQRWKGLMSKDSIKKELQTERENLLAQVIGEVQKYREEFEVRTGQSLEQIPGMERPPQSANVSDTISAIIWSRQLSLKIQGNHKVASSLFGDLQSLQKMTSDSQDLCGSIKAYEDNLFSQWVEKLKRALNDPKEKTLYEMSGQLMDFDYDAGGLLKVNYSEKLVTLVKDARVLGEHGFRIPKPVHNVTENAKKFYKEGVTLKQVANFYNSMGAQVIDCQKPMMLDKLQQFEYLIKNPKAERGSDGRTVTWKDPIEIEKYIKQVKLRATELIAENRKLRKVHMNMTEMIIELMNIDLLKNRPVWVDNLSKMKKTIDMTTKNRTPEMCKLWYSHINFQLYKALEFQYQMGLESLNESLPEIQADMVFRNQTLEFRPTFEDLKQKYYREIQGFITFPLRFPGIGKGNPIFKAMPEANAKHVKTVYVKAEELFGKLQRVTDEYISWTALGNLDLQSHIEQHFEGVQDWENSFQMLRQKRKELKKLPDSTKVDCINVSLVPFKSGIEELFRRLSDALVETLQESIEKDSDIVHSFVKKGLEKLGSNPQSVEEIEQMHRDAVEIGVEKEGIVKIFDGCEKKNKMIKQMTGQAMRLGEIESMWREFDARLAAFNDKIEDQKARLVQELDNKVKALNSDLEKMFDKWQEKKPKERNQLTYEEALETAESMKELRTQWEDLEKRVEKVTADCKHFGRDKPQLTYYDKMKDELEEQNASWGIFEDFRKNLDEFAKEEWLTFRKKGYFAFQDFFIQQAEKLKQLPKNVVVRFLLKQIEEYKQAWPLFKLCTGEAFEKEHWRKLITILQMPRDVTFDNMKFGHLVDAVPVMLAKQKDIKELSDKAQGEVTIREAINELRIWCDTTEFILTEYESNGRTTPLIKEWKEVITQVSDHQSLILSLKESRYFASFGDQIEQFEKRFGGIDDYLAKLNIIQRKWVYLEPIFMRGALPQEQGRFKRVDEEYRSIALGIGSDPKVMSLCEIPGLKDTLETIVTQLDMCQKALNDYLEEKRQKFSRFYFIGDDDLLEILGQAKNPLVIQNHLKKLFAGIHKVEFNRENTMINSMISSQGEFVPLAAPVQISDTVEDWLSQLEKVMRVTLDNLLKKTISGQGLDIVNLPSQICCLAEMIQFNTNCVKAIKANKLANYKGDLQNQLESYTGFDNKGDNLLFSKVKSLILDLIHNIDIVDQLLGDKAIMNSSNPNDWQWFKQLRYQIDNQNVAKVGMCDAFFDYTYEYQGNAAKLVHTPLTDKCFLTLVMGMKLGYGGNPYGPAGTGKTESVKALGQAFGRQVLVFNCDEGLDYKAMGRIFIGLVKCGAWGCFDEFNRLLEEQLSAISQQIQVIQWAIKEGMPTLELLGRNINVNKNAGIFVTMNPAGKGYGGRSKLPDNLKQLFRPVAMSAPDIELIAENILFTQGFKFAKKLATKIVSLFKLCGQLLSTQQHYDWKLRAQKPILETGGHLMQIELKKGRKLSYEDEQMMLIKSIRVNTISKLTYADAKKYEALQADMFPNIKSEEIAYEELADAIRKVVEELKLQHIEKQVQKILQFYEATKHKMGVVIVGPSGCGKTTIWKVLKLAFEKLNRQVVAHVMNPKSMPREQLLGIMNHDTREFQDGVLTSAARQVVKEPAETICWVVNDGDIDPEWIESLNSVMDDNHLLTLPNGERISLGDNINFIFEANDLRFASPATVSRLGMIFLSEEDVDVGRITKTWINKQPEDIRTKLTGWMEELFFPALKWILQHQEQMITETTKVGIVNNGLAYLTKCTCKSQFVHGLILGLGGNFNYKVRTEFAETILNAAGERVPDSKNLLLNHFDTTKNTWMSYVQEQSTLKIDDMKDPEKPPILKTASIQKDLGLVKPLLDRDESFILVGPEGCGKSLVIRSLIGQMKSTALATIHCNAQTSAFHVIQKLNQMCAQSTNSQGRVYRPKEAQRLIIYLKDINLPKPDKYDTIQLICFLQQIVCYKGFYDKNLDFVSLERIQIVASMNPSTTIGRHKISSRFTANVRVCYMDYPSAEELLPVYTEFMKTILSNPKFGGGKMANSCKRLSSFLIDLYSNVKSKFSVDDHRHYLFTPREVTQCIFQLLRYDINDAQALIEVLVYESQRVYKDRLVDKDSKKRLDSIMYTLLKNHLKYQEKLVDTFFISKIAQGNESLIPGLPPMGRIGKQDFIGLIDQAMRAYEREFKSLELHLVDEVLDLIANVERVISMPGGCLLLAGRAGVGRKQVTQLISQLLNTEFFSPNINRDYSMKEFKRDLKVVLQQAGVEATKVCLYVEDHQLLQSEFLELLNSLISAGEVPGLYTPEELEPLLAQLQDEMREQYECKTLFEFFVSRVRKNLNVVVSLDNKHPKFTANCASNPALFTKSIILWNEGLSKESLQAVARAELEQSMAHLGKSADQIIGGAVYLHNQSTQDFGVSPQHFINFIQNYNGILKKILETSGGQSKHLKAGLEKLSEAAEMVDKLSREANEKQKKLAVAQKKANEAMGNIQVSMEQKAARAQEVEKLEKHCKKDASAIDQRKAMVEEELGGIQPEVDAAKEAVGELKASNINEIKGFRQPPPAVEHVLSAVMQFMGQTDVSWNGMKRFLSNAGVVGQIINFDARNVTPKLRKKVAEIIAQNPSSFEKTVIERASRACSPLAAWVKANVIYSEILLKIEPLTSELDGLLYKLSQSQARVDECQVQLKQLSDATEQLNKDFQKKTVEAAKLEADLKQTQDILSSASTLLGQLSGENDRWHQQVKQIENEMALVPAKALVSSAYLTYLGSENESIRERTLRDWLTAVKISDYNFKNFLSSEAQMLTWKKEGLPADGLSMENGVMILNSQRTPLIIDPATQASEWLKHSLRQTNDNVEILNHQDPKYNTNIELAIRFGKVLIIQEVDGIESILVPILRKDLMQQGPRQVVQIGEKAVDYNPAFRLYLTTRDKFVDIPPNCAPLISNINFTVTKSGLEGQLLSITINFEQPELEARKTQLLEEEEKLKVQLAGYEKQLLTELANSKGNILENKVLIDSLNQTKTQSSQIEQALGESKNLQVSLDQQREVYRNFALIGSNLFMVFGDLIKMNNMYQFSLSSFIQLFNRALSSRPDASSTEEKLQKLSNNLVKICYAEIGRSLFKADRLTYSLHFVKGVFPQLFGKNEWDFFKGNVAGSDNNARLPKWAAQDRADVYSMFASTFGMLANQLQFDNDGIWSKFATSETAERDIPQQVASRITPFQQLLVVQTFRPDRLESAMQNFVKEAFGGEKIDASPFHLQHLFEKESTSSDPILFIISPGSDPSAELSTFAEQAVGRACYHELAMGGGQNDIAIETIKNAAIKGEWVCLKNLHLVTPWLSILEKEFKMLKPDRKFRLWLTSEPHIKFPSILLQSSIKITYETPPGVKNNLNRTFQSVVPAGAPASNTPQRSQLLFILSWFHALIQERRTYIPQGWVKYYEFSYGDLKAGEQILSEVLAESKQGSPAWQKIYGILENCIYGGRVDNDYDMRVLSTYMREIFTDSALKGQQELSGLIAVPQGSNPREFNNTIAMIPEQDTPSIFGLPANIDRSVQRFNSTGVIGQLKSLAAASSQELRFDKEKWTEQLGPLCQLWQNSFRMDLFKSIKVSREDLVTSDPVDNFVFMEFVAVRNMLVKVNESVNSIIRVLQGNEMLTPQIQQEATCLLSNTVPPSWEKQWEGPETPSAWIRVANKKGSALVNWCSRVQGGGLLKNAVNLSDLLHPETFLNALRQRSARLNKVAIDELKLVSTFEQLSVQGTIKVEGLSLQGCDFDGRRLSDIRGQALEVIQLPTCSIAWISNKESDPYKPQECVDTPVYHSLDREKLLCTFQMANNGDQASRIISGVAVFLSGTE